MKRITQRSTFIFIALTLSLALVLSACSPSAVSSQGSASGTSAETQATTVPAAPGACLVGNWGLTDFSAYMNSIAQNITNNSQAAVTITSGDFSGSAVFTFNADNTAQFSADNFTQKFTLTTSVSGQNMDIPITLTVNGTSTAKYSVDGDKISFIDQQPGDTVITTEVMGNTSTIDQSLLGKPGTIQLYQYACSGADSLSLKVIAVENMDLAPLSLTRIK